MRRIALAAALLLGLTAPALGDIDTGVDAFERGDYAAAYREWKPLADEGDANAQYNLGSMYYHVEQNYAEVIKWLRLSAEQGHASARHDLGAVYTSGHGVKQSSSEAGAGKETT